MAEEPADAGDDQDEIPGRPRKLRGRGYSARGTSLGDEVRRRVEQAAHAAHDAAQDAAEAASPNSVT